MGSGPLWPQAVENMAHICHQNWWLNIFFLNNFQSPNNLVSIADSLKMLSLILILFS